ncbi:MAG TPA: ATP-binding protein [Chitinophagaceae bacterium]|jgi:signal transduction histidine kinase
MLDLLNFFEEFRLSMVRLVAVQMIRVLISSVPLCFIFYFHLAAQDKTPYPNDTTAINSQIKKALVFAQNPATIDSADYYLHKFYASSLLINYDKGIVEYFRIKAVSFFIQQKDDSLAVTIQQAFNEAKRFNNIKELALVLDLKAWIFQNKEENDSAAHYYISALQFADSSHDIKFSGEIANNLSVIFWSIGDYNKAASYASSAYRSGLSLGDTMLITNGLFNFGNAKTSLKQYDTGFVLYNRVQEIVSDPVKYNGVLFRTLGNEASILTETNRLDESIKKYQELLQLSKEISPSLLSYIYSGLGGAQLKKGLLRDAEENLTKAIKISNDAGQKQSLRDSYLLMSEVKKDQGDFESALSFREKYGGLNDTLNSEAGKKDIHLLEKKYNIVKKDNEIAQQQLLLLKSESVIRDKNNLNTALIAGIIILSIIALLVYRNFLNRQRILQQSEALKKQKIIELEKQQQLTAAQSVLKGEETERSRLARDLHDGVGGLLAGVKFTMSNMRGNMFLTEENASAFNNAILQLDLSIEELRRVSHNMMPEALIKYGLKETLENYCESLNQSGGLKANLQTYNLQQRMDQNTEIVIYRIIQELLNNIMKHAAAKNVLIQLMRENNRFSLTVEDDGKGFDIHEVSHGAGLANIKARTEYLNGYADIVSKKGEGTSVHIEGNCEV